jgi:hypothetical protein
MHKIRPEQTFFAACEGVLGGGCHRPEDCPTCATTSSIFFKFHGRHPGDHEFLAAPALLALTTLRLLLASAIGVALVRSQSAAPKGTWSTKAALPTKRFEVGAVTLGGKFYVLAGESNGEQATTLNSEYDPATNRWRELARSACDQPPHGVTLAMEKICLGGFTGVPHLGAMDIAFEYDVALIMGRLPPLSSPRAGRCCVRGRKLTPWRARL